MVGDQSKYCCYGKESFCYRGLGVQGKRTSFSYMIESDNYGQALAASSLATVEALERFSLPGFQWALFDIITVNTKQKQDNNFMFQYLCFQNDLKESEEGSKFTSAPVF